MAQQTDPTIDLPGAVVADEWTTSSGKKFVRIAFNDTSEHHYIIGQMQNAGYDVNRINFEFSKISFSKADD